MNDQQLDTIYQMLCLNKANHTEAIRLLNEYAGKGSATAKDILDEIDELMVFMRENHKYYTRISSATLFIRPSFWTLELLDADEPKMLPDSIRLLKNLRCINVSDWHQLPEPNILEQLPILQKIEKL